MNTRLNALTRSPLSRFGAAVVLAAAAAATGLALAQPAPMGPGMGSPAMAMPMAMGSHGGHHGGEGGPGMGLIGGRGLERLLDSVQATDAQRTQIRQITEAARKDLQTQREAGRGLRDRAMNAFTQPTVDAREVESVRQAMLAQHDAASRRTSQAMLEVAQVLTPAQRAQLAQQMKQRSERWQQRMEERQRPGAPQS